MVKYSRQLHIMMEKKKVFQRNMTKKEMLLLFLNIIMIFLISRERINRTDNKGSKTGKMEGFLSER